MAKRYNIYFSGQMHDGNDAGDVRARLGKLFKANDATLDKLFSGKPQLIKRDCDEATARKYRDAMEKAGAIAVIKLANAQPTASAASSTATTPETSHPAQPSGQSSATPPVKPSAETSASPTKPMTAAEKIAALAAAPDVSTQTATEGRAQFGAIDERPPETDQTSTTPTTGDATDNAPSYPAPAITSDVDTSGMILSPEGSDVLAPDERTPFVPANVDTSALAVDATAERLAPPTPNSPAAPDTSHLDMGAVGETIPTLPRHDKVVSPDISGLVLSPEDSDLSEFNTRNAPPPTLDLSGLEVAEAGADVLAPEHRKRDEAIAPNTDHLQLND